MADGEAKRAAGGGEGGKEARGGGVAGRPEWPRTGAGEAGCKAGLECGEPLRVEGGGVKVAEERRLAGTGDGEAVPEAWWARSMDRNSSRSFC